MYSSFSIVENAETIAVAGRHYKLEWNRASGMISRVALFDGIRWNEILPSCLLYTSPSPRDRTRSRMPSSA